MRALGLDPALEERFAYYVERLLREPRMTSWPLRSTMQDVVLVSRFRGLSGEAIVERVETAVLGHARECGHTATSVVTGKPRALAVARRVAKWAAERCAPEHPYLLTRRDRRRRGARARSVQSRRSQ
jgi:hypothetical protein